MPDRTRIGLKMPTSQMVPAVASRVQRSTMAGPEDADRDTVPRRAHACRPIVDPQRGDRDLDDTEAVVDGAQEYLALQRDAGVAPRHRGQEGQRVDAEAGLGI